MNTNARVDGQAIAMPLVVLLALLTALDAMAIDMYLPGMPMIASDLDVSPGHVQRTLSVFLAGLAIGQGICGPLLDRFGRRWPLLIGVAIFAAGSVMAALAPTVEWLLVARFAQALGAAAGLVAPRAIVADLYSLDASARIFSLLMQVMMVAPVLAPLLGGYVLLHQDWRFIFWIMAALGVVGLFWSMYTIPESLPAERRVPLAFGSILRAFTGRLRDKVYMAYAIAGGFMMGSLFAYISASAFVFTAEYGLSASQFSYLFAANSVALVLGGYISSRLLKRGVHAWRIVMVGLVLHALAGLVLFLAVRTGIATLAIYSGALALAVGSLGLIFGNLTALTMNETGGQAGVASALMGVLHYLMAAIIGVLVSAMGHGAGSLPLAMAACGVLGLLSCLAVQRPEAH